MWRSVAAAGNPEAREAFPEAIVLPNLVVGGTDARFFAPLSESVYRLSPFVLDRSRRLESIA